MTQHIFSSLSQDAGLWVRAALRSSVAKNAASLYLLQFANYILPFITVPYLVRALGPAGFGIVAFCQSLIAYFALFVDYGFALSATRKISLERDNLIAIRDTVFTVWAAKTLLCLAGIIILLLLVASVPRIREVSALLFILYGMVLGNVLSPTWFFQGIQKIVFISVINLIVRVLVAASIFTLVRKPDDYLIYAVIMSLGSIAAGIAAASVALYKFKLTPVVPSFRSIWQALAESWLLFLSVASTSLYTLGNAFILGLLTNHTVVGYYSAAEKTVKAVLGLLDPLSQAAYPSFSKMASESKVQALEWARRMLVLMSGLGLALSIALSAAAPVIVRILLGPDYGPSVMVVRILAVLCFLVSASNVLGIQIMLPFGKDRVFMLVLLSAGLINIAFAIVFAPIWQEYGMAIAVVLSEMFVTVAMFLYLWLCQLNPLINRPR